MSNRLGTTTSGPLSRPSSTSWRRERLLRIGSNVDVHDAEQPIAQVTPAEPNEETALRRTLTATSVTTAAATAGDTLPSYGTLPSSRLPFRRKTPFRRGLPSLLDINLPSSRFFSISTPTSPIQLSPSYFRGTNQRSISAYDAPLAQQPDQLDKEVEADAKTNGIRVWYSSFSSIDWLHDAIKDSVRFSRLRKRKSLRARLRLAFDKCIGWWIVTIIGFLTAIVAFLIVRSEQWLFSLKEGYCSENVWRAKRLCCPPDGNDAIPPPDFLEMSLVIEDCVAWRTWSQVFGSAVNGDLEGVIQYIAYAFVAVSTLLSIRLQHSLLFSTIARPRCHVMPAHDILDCFNVFYHSQGIWRISTSLLRSRRSQVTKCSSCWRVQTKGHVLRAALTFFPHVPRPFTSFL
jgi:chloride channel 3/4/5